MRLLRRQRDDATETDDPAAAETKTGTATETSTEARPLSEDDKLRPDRPTARTHTVGRRPERPRLPGRRPGPTRPAEPERPLDTTAETPVTETPEAPAAPPERREGRRWFRRTETVPITVPQRALRRTMRVPARRVQTTKARHQLTLAPLVSLVAGAALTVIGIVALIRTGVNETWFRPEAEVLGANHTQLLGVVEIGSGVLLLLLGLLGSRVLVAVAGLAGALLATAAAVEPAELARELAIERWWALTLAAAGVVLTLVALQAPRGRQDTMIEVE
jgi:hypothetical protein